MPIIIKAGSLTSQASRWVAGTNKQWVGYAANSDRTSWTFYDRIDAGQPMSFGLAYGKDASGNGIYVITNSSSSKQVSVSSTDVTDGNAWTHKDLGYYQYAYGINVAWSNNVWIAAGVRSAIWRSTDGAASWTRLDLSSVAGWDDDDPIEGLAADGNGNWLISQDGNIYSSTNDGATWARVKVLASSRESRGLAFTNGVWVCAYTDGSPRTTRLISANPSDLTTWSAFPGATTLPRPEQIPNTDAVESRFFRRNAIAADGTGRVVVAPYGTQKMAYADVGLDGSGNPTMTNFNVVDVWP